MSYNMMIGYECYDIYDHFTMEHFPLRQSMILTTIFFARDSIYLGFLKFYQPRATGGGFLIFEWTLTCC
jgi:hypothetical protein